MKYIAIIDSVNELSEDAIKELKETVFVSDEKAPYCFDITSIKTLEQESASWCADCKEYDQDDHCCHRFSKVIRDTVEKMKQESVLDKIEQEIKSWYWQADKQKLAEDPCVVDSMIDLFIRIIDKYRSESGEKE